MLDIGLILGGPSEERGISLNSARSIADHIASIGVTLKEIVYFNHDCVAFSLDPDLLYCNTPSDFDYELSRRGTPLVVGDDFSGLEAVLKSVQLVFPAIHGTFGEDGQLQKRLENWKVPFVGTGAEACATAFDKFRAKEALARVGLPVVPSQLVTPEHSRGERYRIAASAYGHIPSIVLKPACSGSSYGVKIPADREEARWQLDELVDEYGRVLVQPLVRGIECTTVVLEGPDGHPVALMPTEIEILNKRDEREFFDARRKYLSTTDTRYHCPARLVDDVTERIQRLSEQVFSRLRMRDFARIDCWVQEDGSIVISDVNPISGMEQTSLLFVQAAQIGMNHADLLRHVIRTAAARCKLDFSPATPSATATSERRRVRVLFGGKTAERQVSVLSGLNVWLKLLESPRFEPEPYLLDPSEELVWHLSYAAALHHTVEEIVDACGSATGQRELRERLADSIHARLGLTPADASVSVNPPKDDTRVAFLDDHAPVFLALHGGIGENGTLQRELEERGIPFNGSGSAASETCMDKFETGNRIRALADPDIGVARQDKQRIAELRADRAETHWKELTAALRSETVIVKPVGDGCSAGIVRLDDAKELRLYLHTVEACNESLRAASSDVEEKQPPVKLHGADFKHIKDGEVVEMPETEQHDLLFEEYVITKTIKPVNAADGQPAHLLLDDSERDIPWVEITVGVLGHRGEMRVLPPSLPLAANKVLSLEEKFMGGTGINLTPPPEPPQGGPVAPGATEQVRKHIKKVADLLGLEGYARIDAFMHCATGQIKVIEVNTLPGLSPSTVIFQQAVAGDPKLRPREFLEEIIELSLTRP